MVRPKSTESLAPPSCTEGFQMPIEVDVVHGVNVYPSASSSNTTWHEHKFPWISQLAVDTIKVRVTAK